MEFEGAKGWLIGTENRGLNHMFTFINTSRVGTAVQGVAAAEVTVRPHTCARTYAHAHMRTHTCCARTHAPAHTCHARTHATHMQRTCITHARTQMHTQMRTRAHRSAVTPPRPPPQAAFQNSLWYCKERKSMRALSGTKLPEAAADPIIWQPAVRTMLLTQKAVAEGGRSMVFECAKIADRMQARLPPCCGRGCNRMW